MVFLFHWFAMYLVVEMAYLEFVKFCQKDFAFVRVTIVAAILSKTDFVVEVLFFALPGKIKPVFLRHTALILAQGETNN